MLRFVFRVLATVSLAVAVVMAVIDATRSIAASDWITTPLAESWQAVSLDTFEAAAKYTNEAMLPELWDPVAMSILALPGFVVFLVLALLFYLIGRRPERRRFDRFAMR